jgi:type IV pilus assembly protein PilC
MFLAGSVCVVLGSAWLLTGVFRRCIQYVQLSGACGNFFAGSTSNVVAMSRFAATLAELLSIGTPIPEALKVAGIASQRVHFRVRSEQLAQEFNSTKSPSVRSAVAHNFPSTLLYALSAGGDGGPSIPLLRQLAAIYSDRSRNRSQLSSSFNSSIMVAIVGALVGFVVVSLFMPLISLITSLS